MAENNGVDSNKLRYAGDINVKHAIITSFVNDKKVNVTNQILTIQIFEDLFSPFITGTLILKESLDLAANFPFVGEEILDLKLFTPTLDDTEDGVIQGTFYIYKMGDREQFAERSNIYQLHFISVEAVVDINTKISKGFDGLIHEIVPKLLKDKGNGLATDKNINVEATDNKIKYVSNFWTPLKNIMFLADHAVAHSDPSFIFFENRKGFNFITLDSLNNGPVKTEFEYNNSTQEVSPGGGSVRNLDVEFKKITEFHTPTTFDYMDKVSSGAFNSTMLFMDLTTKKYKNLRYSIFDDQAKRLNDYPPTSPKVYTTFRSKMFSDNIQTEMFTDFGDVSTASILQSRTARLKQSTYFRLRIVVPGRTDYTVGQKVYIKKYKAEPINKEDKEEDIIDNITSGNYLIGSINHVIDREKHECHMELIKDSLIVGL